ncbi:MAG: hypothetical protein HQ523_13130 [Lentisphaerae bacterium]|nr:hypothetical protein [Lentisphaerota bacterium]
MTDEILTPEEAETTTTVALLFELENVAFQGRRVVFDVLKSMLADKDMDLTPIHFSRCCVDTSVEVALPHLLELMERQRISADKMVPEILQAIRATLIDNTPASPKSLSGLLNKAQAEGYKLGAVSDMDAEAAAQLFARLDVGEPEEGAIMTTEDELGTGDSQAWQNAARALDAVIPSCVAITTSNRAAHAAVSAGMRCVVIPDKYTSFQDFGGSDRILDTLDDAACQEILGMLAEHA